MNYCIKQKLIYCCYLDTLVLAKCDREKCQDKILGRTKIADKQYLFSVLLNSKSHFLFKCLEHVSIISYDILMMLNASTKKHSLTFENSNIGLKNYYLKTVFKNNLEDVIIYLVFNFKLLKKKYYVCNCLFDECLESIP